MSKAEKRALELYPEFIGAGFGCSCDYNQPQRTGFIEGYRQAEKDLELTWEDIKEICDITFEEACRLQRHMKGSLIYKKQHYQKVLKQFKAQKGE